MTQELTVFFSGLLLVLLPFFGIPTQWKLYVVSGIGVLLIILGYRLRYRRALREMGASDNEKSPIDGFQQATPPLFTGSTTEKQ